MANKTKTRKNQSSRPLFPDSRILRGKALERATASRPRPLFPDSRILRGKALERTTANPLTNLPIGKLVTVRARRLKNGRVELYQ